jgi:hypothetical protein
MQTWNLRKISRIGQPCFKKFREDGEDKNLIFIFKVNTPLLAAAGIKGIRIQLMDGSVSLVLFSCGCVAMLSVPTVLASPELDFTDLNPAEAANLAAEFATWDFNPIFRKLSFDF